MRPLAPFLFSIYFFGIIWGQENPKAVAFLDQVALYSNQRSAEKLAEMISFPIDVELTHSSGKVSKETYLTMGQYVKDMGEYFSKLKNHTYSNNILQIIEKGSRFDVTQIIQQTRDSGKYTFYTKTKQSLTLIKIDGALKATKIHNYQLEKKYLPKDAVK